MKTELTAKMITDAVKGMAGIKELMFDTPISVKTSPHAVFWNLELYGIQVDNHDNIWLATMDWNGNITQPLLIWTILEERDVNYELVLSSLYQRVYLLSSQKKEKKDDSLFKQMCRIACSGYVPETELNKMLGS
jgi:hypothetical protein